MDHLIDRLGLITMNKRRWNRVEHQEKACGKGAYGGSRAGQRLDSLI